MDSTETAFSHLWPEAETFHLLDSSLSTDRANAGKLTDDLSKRIIGMAEYAAERGVDGVLYCCSAFGPAIEAAADANSVPVLKPNEAMFESALDLGGNLVMLVTFKDSIGSMEQEFAKMKAARGSDATLRSVLVEGARDAIDRGDAETHNRLIAEAAQKVSDCSAVLLAHFSMDRARAAVADAIDVPVLSPPSESVTHLSKTL
tara:strand:+ start:1413 stop:2021 length:609 start_codon:yes stop_codon:yes gene_type:complete